MILYKDRYTYIILEVNSDNPHAPSFQNKINSCLIYYNEVQGFRVCKNPYIILCMYTTESTHTQYKLNTWQI